MAFESWAATAKEEGIGTDDQSVIDEGQQQAPDPNQQQAPDPNEKTPPPDSNQKLADSGEKNFDFDENKFTENYKKSNPNATPDEIASKIKEAENAHYTITKDFFEEDKPAVQEGKSNFIEQFKKIAREDFDEIEHSTIQTEEDYTAAIDSVVNKRVEKAVQEAKVNNEFLEKLPAIDKVMFDILKNSGIEGLREYITPDKKIEGYLAMDDESLLIQTLKVKKDDKGGRLLTDDEITAHVSKMTPEDITAQGKILRSNLNAVAQNKREQVAQMIQKDNEMRRNQGAVEREKTSQQMRAVLAKKTDYYGLNIDPGAAEAVATQYLQGRYDHLLKDPTFLVNAILNHKLGPQAFARHGKAKYEEGAAKKNAQDHNADIPGQGSGGGQSRQGQNNGHFGSWTLD